MKTCYYELTELETDMQIGTRVAIYEKYGRCRVGKQGIVVAYEPKGTSYLIEVEMDDGKFWLFEPHEIDEVQ